MGRHQRLVRDRVIGGAPGTPAELINPLSLAVDGEGRVYVGDRSPAAIRLFAPDGEFVRTIGREGAGPGEAA